MRKTLSILTFTLALAVLFSLPASAQQLTPNTTLCAAQTATQNSICLTATSGSSPTWGIYNQTGIYVDGEYELVILSNSQTISGSNQYVPVSRGNRGGKGSPAAHLNGARAWIAMIPSLNTAGGSNSGGANGFDFGTQHGDYGACTRTSIAFLPHIWVDQNVKRDCNVSGVYVDYAPQAGLDYPSPTPLTAIVANTALSVSSGRYILNTKAGVIALTLAAPTAGSQDGMVITITSNNGANADTLTATGLIQTGGAGSPYTTATFGVTTAYNGASLTLYSYNGFWYVLSSVNVSFS